MPVTKIKPSSTPDVMKSGEGHESLGTVIRQAIGREPFLSCSRATDNPVQLIQLLHALDQQVLPADFPGWSLFSPMKVQMQKCDKCSREFYSPINYRRHLRVHHRLKKLDQETTKNRELLGAFWDKLSVDDVKEIASIKNDNLEEVTGASLVKALTSLVCKPGFSYLPHVCLKAGSALLDIIQGRPLQFPISSHELFSILDDASEKTFLCGRAMALQKYVFDGEARKTGLETKNVIACISFLLELKLLHAWFADKDAEALKCQKLLVEEEEAAQKRQAELLERKLQKRLRQQEQKAKEQICGERANVNECTKGTSEAEPAVKKHHENILEAKPVAETSFPSAASDSERQIEDRRLNHALFSETTSPLKIDVGADNKAKSELSKGYTNSSICGIVEQGTVQGNGRRPVSGNRWQVPLKPRGLSNGFRSSQTPQESKLRPMQKHGNQRDARVAPLDNGNRAWSRKLKPGSEGYHMITKAQGEAIDQTDKSKNWDMVLIGSISVSLGSNRSGNHGTNNIGSNQDDFAVEHQMEKDDVQIKPVECDSVQSCENPGTVKLWRPVSRHVVREPALVPSKERRAEADGVAEKRGDKSTSAGNCSRSGGINGQNGEIGNTFEDGNFVGSSQRSSLAAKAFLAERWKVVVAADHMKLALRVESDPPHYQDIQKIHPESKYFPMDVNRNNITGILRIRRSSQERMKKLHYQELPHP